jgi:hypothetical protein
MKIEHDVLLAGATPHVPVRPRIPDSPIDIEYEDVDYLNMPQDRDKDRTVVNTAMNLYVP